MVLRPERKVSRDVLAWGNGGRHSCWSSLGQPLSLLLLVLLPSFHLLLPSLSG